MPEPVAVAARLGREDPRPDRLRDPGLDVDLAAQDRVQDRVREPPVLDAGRVHDCSSRGAEARERRRRQLPQGLVQRLLDRPARLRQQLGVERQAAGELADPVRQHRRRVAAAQRLPVVSHLVPCERPQGHRPHVGQPAQLGPEVRDRGRGGRLLGAQRAGHHQPGSRDGPHHPGDQCPGRAVRPVQVLDPQPGGALVREVLEQGGEPLEQPRRGDLGDVRVEVRDQARQGGCGPTTPRPDGLDAVPPDQAPDRVGRAAVRHLLAVEVNAVAEHQHVARLDELGDGVLDEP